MQPPSGPQARADVEERCHLAAALEAPRAAAPRAPQPIWLRRAARGWAALRTPSRVLLAVGDAQHAALLHDRGPSKFLRQTAPQLELTGSAGLVVSQRLADAADGLREGPGRPSAARRPGRATARGGSSCLINWVFFFIQIQIQISVCPFPSLVTPMSVTDSSLPPQAVTSLEVVGLACDAQPASRPSDVVSHSSRCATLPASRSRAMQTSWARSLLHHQAVRWLTSAAPDLPLISPARDRIDYFVQRLHRPVQRGPSGGPADALHQRPPCGGARARRGHGQGPSIKGFDKDLPSVAADEPPRRHPAPSRGPRTPLVPQRQRKPVDARRRRGRRKERTDTQPQEKAAIFSKSAAARRGMRCALLTCEVPVELVTPNRTSWSRALQVGCGRLPPPG